jgi:transposase
VASKPHRRIVGKLLGSLPVVARFADRLGVREIIDRLCPSRGNAHLTHGQVALSIIGNRLTSPRGLYRLVFWAREWALRDVWGIDAGHLNDDRLGRCLDALHDRLNLIQGEVALRAVQEFDLRLDQLHGDLTSVVLQGRYPEGDAPAGDPEPEAGGPLPARPAFGYGGKADCRQFRVLEIGTLDGMVPLWHRTHDGNQADVGTVIAEMETLQKHVPVPGCAIVGDSKLLTHALIPKLRKNGWDFLAPLPSNPALDAQCLELPGDGWERLDYAPRRAERRPEEDRSVYSCQEVRETWEDPETGKTEVFRKLFIHSSALAAQQGRLRLRRVAAAAKELNALMESLPKRARGMRAATLEAKALAILEKHRVKPFFTLKVTAGKPFPLLAWEENQEALEREKRLDGRYALYTSLDAEKVPALEVLRRWKQQGDIERRFSDWKGPLQVHPVFLKTPKRIAALILLLHLALMIYCLIEREARRRLAEQGQTKLPRLLAGHVDAIPTGENILRALQGILLLVEEGQHERERWLNPLRPEQHNLLRLLGVPIEAWI